jgi:hypothetical protein
MPSEVDRYARFMDDLCHMVVDKYDGSLEGRTRHGVATWRRSLNWSGARKRQT